MEVDLPAPLDYKEEVLAAETPRCKLERVRLDLADVAARQALFAELCRGAGRGLAISEGLLLYFGVDQVAALGGDLAAVPAMQRWLVDVVSPGLLARMQKTSGKRLQEAQAPFRFGPAEGPAFFTRCGWQPLVVRSLFQEARRLRRLPLLLRLFAWIPEPQGPAGKRPWSAVCTLGRGAG